MQNLIIGSGYLGRRVGRIWVDRGNRVAALTRSEAHARELVDAGIKPFVGDVTEPATLDALPDARWLLYSVGFDRHASKSRRAVSIDGLKSVLERVGARVGGIIFTSSISVYGQTNGEWVNEASPCAPAKSNGQICLEAESILWDWAGKQTRPVNVCVLRLAGLYGPGRLLRRIEQLKTGEPLDRAPDAYLNLIHVADAARAIIAGQQRGGPGRTYLICDDHPTTRREYYTRLASLVGAPTPTFREQAGSEGANLNKRCDNRLMHRELNVELEFPTIESGLPHAVPHSR